MSTLHTQTVNIPCGEHSIRAHLAMPSKPTAKLPVVVAWSDIFQLTPSHLRIVHRLASYGYAVLAPELYTRLEPAGTVLDFERDRQRALDDSARVQLSWVDEDREAVFSWLLAQSFADSQRLGVCGWCFGGHVAFRAALDPRVRATACFYATGVHNGNLGAAQGTAGTLERAHTVKGSLLLTWGRSDPHIPPAGRKAIHRALEEADVRFETRYFDAEHAFMRDEGPRYDPEATDRAFGEFTAFFRREL